MPHGFLFGSDVRIACIGEDEEIERSVLRLLRQRRPDRLEGPLPRAGDPRCTPGITMAVRVRSGRPATSLS